MAYPTTTVEVALAADPADAYSDIVFAVGDPLVYLRLAEASKAVPAADISGNGRNGAYTDASNLMTFAQPSALTGDTADLSVRFGKVGVNGAFCSIPDTAALRLGGPAASAFSVVAWFKRNASDCAGFLRDHAAPVNPAARVDLQVTSTGVTAWSGGFPATLTAATNDLNWHMVAMTGWSDGAQSRTSLYLDGVLASALPLGAIGLGGLELAGATFIGCDTGGLTSFGNATAGGWIDEYTEYATELTAAQVAAMYQARTIQTPIVWTDISAYVLGGTISRGRQHETDVIQAGTCRLDLDNADGRFDPGYTSGPYYGNLLPMRKIRVKFTYNAITYTRFVGYVERWPIVWQPPGMSNVSVTCVDGFEPLNLADISGNNWAQEPTGSRINRALDAAYWPQADRAVDTGGSSVVAAAYLDGSGQKALSHIQDVAASDLGYFFVDGAGRATFHDRYHRSNHATSQATFGDDAAGTELPYEEIVPDLSKDLIANDVTVTSSAGSPVPQRVTDATSQLRFFPRTPSGASRTILVPTDTEARAMASELLRRYKDAAERLERVTLSPAAASTTVADLLWPQALGRELGDCVTFNKRPGYGGTQAYRVFIEQLTDTFTDVRWETTWQLSPVAQSVWWVLDDTTLSVLDTTTIPAY